MPCAQARPPRRPSRTSRRGTHARTCASRAPVGAKQQISTCIHNTRRATGGGGRASEPVCARYCRGYAEHVVGPCTSAATRDPGGGKGCTASSAGRRAALCGCRRGTPWAIHASSRARASGAKGRKTPLPSIDMRLPLLATRRGAQVHASASHSHGATPPSTPPPLHSFTPSPRGTRISQQP